MNHSCAMIGVAVNVTMDPSRVLTEADKCDILLFCTSIFANFSKFEHEKEKQCITYQNVEKEQKKIVINRTRTSSVRVT